MPRHVRPSGVAFARAAESGHATACPYNVSDSLWLAIGAVVAAVGIDISKLSNGHVLSIADDGGYDAARAAVVAELAQVDALPCAEIEATISDGEGESGAYYGGFYVGGHIVRTFISVEIIWGVFGNEAVKNCREVMAHIRVGILIESQCRRCVFDQQMQ